MSLLELMCLAVSYPLLLLSPPMAPPREVLSRARKSRTLRQRNMVYDLSRTFFIKEVKESFTICNVVLPNSDKLDRKFAPSQHQI